MSDAVSDGPLDDPTHEDEVAYLIALGEVGELDEDEALAYETFWYADRVAEPLLSPDARQLRSEGYSIAHTLDAMRHNLSGDQAPFAYNNGFTAHQAHLIEHTPGVADNLWKQDQDDIAAFVESDAPRDFLVNVLLTAKSPAEALTFRQRWEAAPEADQAVVEREVAVLSALRQDLPRITDCCPTGSPLTAP